MLSITRLLWVSGHINVSAPTLTPGSRFFHTLLLYLHVWQMATFREQRSADDRSHPLLATPARTSSQTSGVRDPPTSVYADDARRKAGVATGAAPPPHALTPPSRPPP